MPRKPKDKSISYKQRLIEVKEQLANRRVSAYRVAVNLIAVYDDPAFLADAAVAGDEQKAVELLDAYAIELFRILPEGRSPFLDLRAMLLQYPKEAEWATGDLSTMYDAMLVEQSTPDDPAPRYSRPRVKRAEYEAVVDQLQRKQAQYERLEKRCDVQETEVQKLRRENAELRDRITELERNNAELQKQCELVPA